MDTQQAAPYRQQLLDMRAALLEQMAAQRGGLIGRAEAAADHFAHPEDSPAQVATEKEIEFAIGEHETAELNAIDGALFGGAIMVRLGLYRALMVFGVLQALSNLGFMALAYAGKSYPMMVFAVGFENLTGGMGTAAFVALMMALCDRRFTATQYALISALSAFGRVYVGPAAGYATDPKQLGLAWTTFFFLTFLVALPGLAFLAWKRATVEALDRPAP